MQPLLFEIFSSQNKTTEENPDNNSINNHNKDHNHANNPNIAIKTHMYLYIAQKYIDDLTILLNKEEDGASLEHIEVKRMLVLMNIVIKKAEDSFLKCQSNINK